MRPFPASSARPALLALLASALLLTPACSRRTLGGLAGSGTTASPADMNTFTQGPSELLKAMTEPTRAIHMDYKAQMQINPKFPLDENARPEVGAVSMVADVSPTELSIVNQRGDKRAETKVVNTKEQELGWSMGKLALLGPLGNVNMDLAFAAAVARPDGTETVNGRPAKRFSFDTRKADAAQKLGMEAAMGMLNGRVKLNAIYGTASMDQETGMMVKFSFDTELSDRKGSASWKEHHEGVVALK